MRHSFATFLFVLTTISSFSQTKNDFAIYSYSIVVSESITDITKMDQQQEIPKEVKAEKSDQSLGDLFPKPDEYEKTYYVDYSGKKTEYTRGNRLIASLVDTLYQITQKHFKDSLNITLLPLNELEGKIKYDEYGYPSAPLEGSKRIAIKKAPGYKRYAKLYINFHTGTSAGFKGLTVGQKLPKVWIKMKVYDENKDKLKSISVNKDFDKDIGVSTVKHAWTQREEYDLEVMRKNLSGLYELTMNDVLNAYKLDE